jgi:hypothetical protein
MYPNTGGIKKAASLFILLVFLSPLLKAGENTFKLGIGLEGNMNTSQGYALGRSLSLDFHYFKYIITGAAITISEDFALFTVFEPEIYGRWYFYDFDFKDGGFFVQGDLGTSVALEDSISTFRVLGGLATGFRFPINSGDYYIESYLRGGYPFLWGFGMRMGCRF